MQPIIIEADRFFELLKARNCSMWEIFSQMIKDEPQEIIFINEDKKVLFNYTLPNNQEQLKKDQKVFTQEFTDKLKKLN